MAFPNLKGKLTLFEKNIKMKLTLLKSCSLYRFFFFLRAACTAILSLNLKNNNTMFTISKTQAMRKLNNPTTTSFAGLFFTVVRFNLLE